MSTTSTTQANSWMDVVTAVVKGRRHLVNPASLTKHVEQTYTEEWTAELIHDSYDVVITNGRNDMAKNLLLNVDPEDPEAAKRSLAFALAFVHKATKAVDWQHLKLPMKAATPGEANVTDVATMANDMLAEARGHGNYIRPMYPEAPLLNNAFLDMAATIYEDSSSYGWWDSALMKAIFVNDGRDKYSNIILTVDGVYVPEWTDVDGIFKQHLDNFVKTNECGTGSMPEYDQLGHIPQVLGDNVVVTLLKFDGTAWTEQPFEPIVGTITEYHPIYGKHGYYYRGVIDNSELARYVAKQGYRGLAEPENQNDAIVVVRDKINVHRVFDSIKFYGRAGDIELPQRLLMSASKKNRHLWARVSLKKMMPPRLLQGPVQDHAWEVHHLYQPHHVDRVPLTKTQKDAAWWSKLRRRMGL